METEKSNIESEGGEQAPLISAVKITVDYSPGRWGQTFHIFDLENREIILQRKDATSLARSILKITQEGKEVK